MPSPPPSPVTAPAANPAATQQPARRPFIDLWIALIVIVVVDVLLFRVGLYQKIMQPESYAGNIAWTWQRLGHDLTAKRAGDGPPLLVIMGDSMARSAVQSGYLDRVLAREGGVAHRTLHLSQGGSSVRSWYHLLRTTDFSGDDVSAVVIGLRRDALRNLSDGSMFEVDLDILAMRLRNADVPRLAQSADDWNGRLRIWSYGLLRMPLMRDDIRQLFGAPATRLAQLEKVQTRRARRLANGWQRRVTSTETLVGAHYDTRTGRVLFARPDPPHWFRRNDTLMRYLRGGLVPHRMLERRQVEQDPAAIAYLDDTIRLLEARGVAVVLAILPDRAFAVDPPLDRDALLRVLVNLIAGYPSTHLYFEPALLDEIEAPQYYRDPVHVNALGGDRFSRGLAEFLVEAGIVPRDPSASADDDAPPAAVPPPPADSAAR
ncbi:MAG: hypothetical protein AAF772_08000 [Acidobacteriota bacterium]